MNENDVFNINKVINILKIKRPAFASEADFQLEMAWIIKEIYPNAKIRLEYCPEFNYNMHIDILVIMNGRWIPIELKYKTKKALIEVNNEKFNLKTHGAKDINLYLYLKDIERIEKIRENVDIFEKGYVVFITNDNSYFKAPRKANCYYIEYSLENGLVKEGKLDWKLGTSLGTKRNHENPIVLNSLYKICWNDYSTINNENFKILVNEIDK